MNIDDTIIYTLKIAFGPMKGTEFIIKYGNCILNSAKDLNYSCIYDVVNRITLINIPSNTGALTLKLVCEMSRAENDDEKLNDNIIMKAEIEYDGKHLYENVTFHRMMFPEYAAFFVKPAHESWNTLKNTVHDSSNRLASVSDVGVSNKIFDKKWLIKLLPMGLFLVIMLILTIYLSVSEKVEKSEKTVTNLSEILHGTTDAVYIYHDDSRSKSVVLVNKKNVADWVQQRLANVNYNKKIDIYLVGNLEDKINEKFRILDMPILKVDLSTYELITVRLLNTDNNAANEKIVKSFFSKEIPYIKNVDVLFYDGDFILQKAIQGIQKSGVQYYSIKNPEKNNIIIKADLNDEQLQTISSFIESFRKVWGDNYIVFSVLLATDYLSGKSFLTGKNGYILLNNNHWYFKSE